MGLCITAMYEYNDRKKKKVALAKLCLPREEGIQQVEPIEQVTVLVSLVLNLLELLSFNL